MEPGKQGDHGVRLHLLGPFELLLDGTPVDVPRTRVRDLLTLLATHSPDIVSHDALIEGLWAEEFPKNPRASLRVVLSRTRASLGEHAEALASTPSGFRLYASTDVAEFLQPAIDSNDSDELVRALALWRGEPHASMLPSISMDAHAHRLNERRLALVTRLAELLMNDGRATAAIGLLEPEVTLRPSSETLALRLAQGYAADGRKAEALRALSASRDALRDELGVNPTPEFEALERQILSDTVIIARTDSTDSSNEESLFVGRTDELEQVLNSKSNHVLLVGEAGIGKTRLLNQARQRIEAEGGKVFRVRCLQSPQQAMEVLSNILTHVLGEASNGSSASQDIAPDVAAAIRRVNRNLVDEPSRGVQAPMRRSGMVTILAGFLAQQFVETNTTLMLDDVQWLDRGSAEVVNELMEHDDVRVLMTARPNSASEAIDFARHNLDVIELTGLDEAHTRLLIAAELGEAQNPELASAIHEQSAGNPFFVELLASLAAEGTLRPNEPLPMTALVAVQSRIDRLSGPSRQTLLTASVLGQSIDIALLTALRPSAIRDLDEAIAEGLIAMSGGDTCYFVHSLVSQGAYELLSDGQQADLHDQAATVLASSPGSIMEYVRHAARAEAHDPYRCIEAHIGGARAQLDTLSHEAAAKQVRSAQRAMSRWDVRDDDLAAQLLLLEGASLRWTDGVKSTSALLDAVSLAKSIGNSELMIDAALALCARGQNTSAGTVDEASAAAVDECLMLDDLEVLQRARLLAGSSLLYAVSPQNDEVHRRFSEAVKIAQTEGDHSLEAEILLETDFGLSNPFDFAGRVEATSRLRKLAGEDPDLRWEAAWLAFGNAVRQANAEEAIEAVAEMRSNLDRCVHRPRHFGMAIVESVICQIAERFDDAEAWAGHALDIGLSLYPESWAMNAYGAVLLGIRRAEGRVAELSDVFNGMVIQHPDFPPYEACAAYAALEAGDIERSSQLFDCLTVDNFGRVLLDGSWTAMIGVLTEVAVGLGREVEAEILYKQLSPFAETMLWSATSPFGAAGSSLAAAARLLGDEEAALDHLATAKELTLKLRPLGELCQDPPTPNSVG